MKKNSCYIFCAGDLYTDSVKIPEDCLVIAADGGIYHTNKLNIKPDIILGDFDSSEFKDTDTPRIIYPTEKDYTDSFIAVQHGFDLGIRNFRIYGALGGKRLEHTLANIQMLRYFCEKGCDITLSGDGQIVKAFSSQYTPKLTFDKSYKGYISIFAASESVEGLTVKGLKYELENSTLTNSFPLGISNEFTGKTAEITFKTGTLILVYSEKEKEK